VSADAVSFTVQVSANGAAPVPTGTLAFTQGSSMPAPSLSQVQGSDKIAVAWLGPITPALTGSRQLGTVNFTIPSNAQDGQSYAVKVLSVSAAYQLSTVSVVPGMDGRVIVSSHPYLVGDVYPDGTDLNSDGDKNDAGEFGDSQITLQDLIYAFRVMVGFAQVPTCSDRFDAMDSYPVDTTSQRGGDGQLTLSDLIVTFRRMVGFDTSSPQRTSRGTACPAGIGKVPPVLAQLGRRAAQERKDEDREAAAALLEFGEPQRSGTGLVRIPVYLRVGEEFRARGLAFAVSLGPGSPAALRFAAAEGEAVGPPSAVDGQLAGKLGVAWLRPLTLLASQRVLLGHIEAAWEGDLGELRLWEGGVSADSQQDGGAIRVGLRGWGESR
jgi:hypothetical protein